MADEIKKGGEERRPATGERVGTRVYDMARDLFAKNITLRSAQSGWTLEAQAAQCFEAALAFERVAQDPQPVIESLKPRSEPPAPEPERPSSGAMTSRDTR